MTWQAWLTLFAIIGSAIWTFTGRPPWVWLALGCLHIEAARWQLLVSASVAARHFAANYMESFSDVRSEVLLNLNQGE